MHADLLYLVGPGSAWGDTEELRYSLRSAAMHLPHRRVVIVGHKPGWLQGVEHIHAGDRFEHPVRNTLAKLELATRSPLLSERFVLMNDDFLLLQHVHKLPHYSLGLLEQSMTLVPCASPEYHQALEATYRMLLDAGAKAPFNYESHHPLPMCKAGALAMLTRFGGTGRLYAWRSAYANWQPSAIDTVVSPDVKVRGEFHIPTRSQAFLSLASDTPEQGLFRAWVKARFPMPSPYERSA